MPVPPSVWCTKHSRSKRHAVLYLDTLPWLCWAHPHLPWCRLATLGCMLHVVAAQDIAHRDCIDAMPQVRQRPLDAAIAPGRMLFGHADDQLLDLRRDTGTSKLTAVLTAVCLLLPPPPAARCSVSAAFHFGTHFAFYVSARRPSQRRPRAPIAMPRASTPSYPAQLTQLKRGIRTLAARQAGVTATSLP